MRNKKVTFKSLGFVNLILAVLFSAIIAIFFSYASNEFNDSLSISYRYYSFLYVLINLILSAFLSYIFIGRKKNVGNKLILGIIILQILFDLYPIFVDSWRYFSMGAAIYPWTIFLLLIHMYLFFGFIKCKDNV